MCLSFVGQGEVDGAAGEHDQGESGVGGMESVGASDDESDVGVQAFYAAVADAVGERVHDQRASVAHGAGHLHERGQPATLRASAPPVQRFDRVDGFEIVGEDGPELFLSHNRPWGSGMSVVRCWASGAGKTRLGRLRWVLVSRCSAVVIGW